MESKKINFNRPIISTEEINKRQNFDAVLMQLKTVKPYLFKKILFFGSIGISCISGIILLNTSTQFPTIKNKAYEEKSTLIKEKVNNTPVQFSINTQKSNFQLKKKSSQKRESKIAVTISSVNKVEPIEVQYENHSLIPQLKKTNLPSVSGVENGEISIEKFLNSDKIEVKQPFEIVRYKLNYFKINDYVTLSFEGDHIPKEIKEEIVNYHNNFPVTITNIIVKSNQLEAFNTSSIQLFLK